VCFHSKRIQHLSSHFNRVLERTSVFVLDMKQSVTFYRMVKKGKKLFQYFYRELQVRQVPVEAS